MTDKSEHPPVPEAFAALGVRPSILRALAEAHFVTPSEIQSLLIPRALAGGDLLGQARTGTGKTAAFGIPVLQRAIKGLATQAIILVPTRELAVQVEAEIKRIAQFTPIRTVAVYGGQKITAQMKFLKHGPEVLVGTPGRVIDLLDRGIIDFQNIRFVVLDEVDRMLDIGFRDDIRNILSRVKGVGRKFEEARRHEGTEARRDEEAHSAAQSSRSGEPEGPLGHAAGGETAGEPTTELARTHHQTIFVSATISPEIEKLSRQYMHEPVEKLIAPGADDKPTVEQVEQFYVSVEPWDKYRALRALMLQENPDLAIVFTRTKRAAEKVAKRLHADGIECREIHGNLAQNKRDSVMKSFRGGKFDVLVATDLASRGIDVAEVSHIINYDIPEDPEVYIHRIGRTARMGAKGKAFTFVTKEQGEELTKVESLINMIVPQAQVAGFTPTPPPEDWTDAKPGMRPGFGAGDSAGAAKPIVSRFERAYGTAGNAQPSAGNSAPSAGNSAPSAGNSAPSAGNSAPSAGDARPSAGESSAEVASGPAAATPPALRRTLGSKIPINRRHKRRR